MQDKKPSKLSLILTGIASIALGCIFFANPAGVTVSIVQLIGWVAVIGGVVGILGAWRSPGPITAGLDLYLGISAVLFGILLVSMPGFFVSWLIVILGIFVTVSGFASLSTANAMRAANIVGGGRQMVVSVLQILLGIVLICSPFALVNVVGTVAGVVLIFNGAGTVWHAFAA